MIQPICAESAVKHQETCSPAAYDQSINQSKRI